MSALLASVLGDGASALPARVIVACTASRHGTDVVRLPDRVDPEGVIAAFLVETAEAARAVFTAIDAPHRMIFVDVERKQDVDLPAIAAECIRAGSLHPHKPNDVTVRSLDVLVTYLVGFDLSGVAVGVVGTGNIAFKAALLLAERGAQVLVHGRDTAAAERTVAAIAAVLPRFAPRDIALWATQEVDLLVSAVSGRGAVGVGWLGRLRPDATVIDVGIGNLSAEFMSGALTGGVRVVRLDVRAAGSQLALPAPAFFSDYFGRGEVAGVPIASGGIVGRRGTIVVDSYARPTRIFGIADGFGALLSPEALTQDELGALAIVEKNISAREEVH